MFDNGWMDRVAHYERESAVGDLSVINEGLTTRMAVGRQMRLCKRTATLFAYLCSGFSVSVFGLRMKRRFINLGVTLDPMQCMAT